MEEIKVLVVEDEGIVARDMQETLESWGYAVPAVVSSGEAAIHKATELQPDLVLMDIVLKGDMDGIEAAAQIHTRFDIPVIFVTAYTDEEMLRRARITEPFAYILKPFDERELHTNIQMALHKHEIERRLRESEARYRAVVEDQTELICRFRPDGTLTFVNEAYCRYFGKKREELIGHSCMPLIPEEDQEIVREQFASLSLENPTVTYEHRVAARNGEVRWQQWSDRAIFDEQNCIVEYQSVGCDITERVRAEEALRESEERYRAIFEQAADSIVLLNAETGAIIEFNDRTCENLGYTREEFQQLALTDVDVIDSAEEISRRAEKILSEGADIFETKHRTKSGEIRSVQVSSRAVSFRGKNVIQGIWRDVTERVRAEEALKASEAYARNVIESSLDMIIASDMERYIVEFNKAAEETFGYRREEVIGEHVDMLYADPQESLLVHQTTVKEGKCVREILDRRKSGEVFPAFLSASVLRDASGEIVGIMGVARDITERKRAEEALRQRNRELAMLNRAGQALASTLDLDQVLVTILEEVRHLLGVVASSIWLTDSETDELVCEQVTGPQSEIVRGWRLAPGEGLAGWVVHHDESLIVPDVRADERYFKRVDEQIGLSLRSILTVPLRLKQSVIGVLQVVDTEVDRFSIMDLELMESLAATAAMAIENARLYEQARRDAETKSTLLREVNHRVKNNLSAIIGLLYAERRRAKAEDQAVYQSVTRNLVNRVQSLATVHSLLSASEWAPLRLSTLAARVIRSSLQMLPHGKHVSVDATPSPVRVTSDQAHNLALVVNELTTNTIKYALQGRNTAHITVRIELDGDTVLFEFRDDGPGYPEEVLQLERYSVGFDLIQNIVRKNLRGELSLRNDQGAVATIQFEAGA